MISETGTRKSAILLMALGEDRAAAALAHLATSEVQTLGLAMAKLASVSKNELNTVLSEFRHETEQLSALHLGSSSYIRAVLKKALGDDRASNLLEDILQNDEPHSGIERLNQLEASEVAELIRDEHPQILATVLIHLDRMKASEVLEKLPTRLRHDVIMRVATFGGVQPSALHELTDVLTEMLSGQGLKRSRLGGVRTAAEIVNLMNSTQEEEAIAHVREHDEALAQRIIDEMFVFENLLSLEDRSIQRLLKDIESDSLIIALKGAPQELRDKFLANMSQRAAETLREDMELSGPVRVSQVETEQKAILQVARRLAEAGEIVIAAPGTDDFV
ncbi:MULTISPECIES: flagellar motor switch protein FliG [Variovorax]|jgi:flagellar motor switch protein FliG|uniref:Flagellar motor switch protein FliG n=1 Tax=Variovorax ginsengisoli TaxID=363844 RepID=A0ABT8SEC7_9BURK|nr:MULTISPECIES: flagellar motor switch protein FliG [Variovorax]HET7836173.1 flagellar motor switch protein FliG [Variovorax sp.]MDM0070949.1 flagellar motor switch protein FliG [Variovorax sp. J31P207]MDM0085150.1 flagellar motor switch protein FliG [Variovorax sp. J31P179]MDN8616651.1 flagellar motor switch protein FliG [Variovorax ginsengisoli]MDO1535821.1 flagellar motor switch protein FliG [Variovorax ginsengisoli]